MQSLLALHFHYVCQSYFGIIIGKTQPSNSLGRMHFHETISNSLDLSKIGDNLILKTIFKFYIIESIQLINCDRYLSLVIGELYARGRVKTLQISRVQTLHQAVVS